MSDDYNREYSTDGKIKYIHSGMEDIMDVKDVGGATSNSEGHWEMRIGGIRVEPEFGELEEVWKNVTVEVVRRPSGEISIGWRRQENTERIL